MSGRPALALELVVHVQHGLGGQIEVADLLVVVHQVALYQVAVILFGLLLWVDGAEHDGGDDGGGSHHDDHGGQEDGVHHSQW